MRCKPSALWRPSSRPGYGTQHGDGQLAGGAVLAAVLFLGEHLTAINCVGLVVLVLGVALFNYTKYKKVITGQAVGMRAAQDHEKGEPRAERHEAHDGERAVLMGGRRIQLGEATCPSPCSRLHTPVAGSARGMTCRGCPEMRRAFPARHVLT